MVRKFYSSTAASIVTFLNNPPPRCPGKLDLDCAGVDVQAGNVVDQFVKSMYGGGGHGVNRSEGDLEFLI